MKTISEISLAPNERKALVEFKCAVMQWYADAEIILYGSKARGDSVRDSDIDLLVVISQKVTSEIEHNLSMLQLRVEIAHDVVLGLFVESRDIWQSPRFSITPLHQNIALEGILV